ncbi:MAG: copper resistance CopC/CopD family protein [Rhizobiaceae bacterium]
MKTAFGRIALAAFALLLQAAAALAHASLTASEPADGSVVPSAPAIYRLTFGEPVSPLTLRLVRPDGTAELLHRFRLVDRTVEIDAPAGLGRGTHVLAWRVVSGDGHPIGGSVVFSIGEASAQAPVVAEAVDRVVQGGLWLAKIALSIGLFIGVGGVFAMRVLMPGVTSGRRVAAAALVIGAAGAIVSGGFQGLDALGAPGARLLDPLVWEIGLGTSYGETVGAAIVALLLAALALGVRGMVGAAVAVLALLAATIAPALSGHASAATPQWLMRPAVFLHVLAIALWVGALAPLGLALRRREPGARMALLRFSTAIPAIVGVLIVAGFVLAVVQVERPAALLETAYGQVFLIKLALFIGLLILAAVNRWFLTALAQAGDASATRRLTRAVSVETVLAIAIFAAAAAWRFTPPPRVLAAEAARPAIVEMQSDKAIVVLWIGPARAGPVRVVANVLTVDYAPQEAKEVTVSFASPASGIEPFRRALQRGEGMADWQSDGVAIPLAGTWRVRVDVLISDFETTRLESEIRIRP